MSSREAIMSRLRARLDRASLPEDRKRDADTRIKSRTQTSLVPKIGRLEGRERIERFISVTQSVHGHVTRIGSLSALPEAVSTALRNRNLGQEVRCGGDPLFDQLDWGSVELSRGVGRVDEPVTLSVAQMGVAETATLVLTSGPENPVTLTFLGETHFVVLKASDVVSNLEGVWAKLRAAGVDPRTVNLVTGPSRTGDIAQQIQLGAHGPVDVEIFLIDDY